MGKKKPGKFLGLYLPETLLEKVKTALNDFKAFSNYYGISQNRFLIALIAIGLEANMEDVVKAVNSLVLSQELRRNRRGVKWMGVDDATTEND